jgi:hypothetical protein
LAQFRADARSDLKNNPARFTPGRPSFLSMKRPPGKYPAASRGLEFATCHGGQSLKVTFWSQRHNKVTATIATDSKPKPTTIALNQISCTAVQNNGMMIHLL